jgi:hypothetical protein
MDRKGNIKPTKSKQTVVRKYLHSFSQQLTSKCGKPLQGAGTPSKPRDAQHLAKVRENGHKMSQKRKFIQINLHRSEAAMALLCQTPAKGRVTQEP